MTSNIVLSNREFSVVGKRPVRHDGYDKVTGKARYGADINFPGLLHGKMLRSPHAHARIISVDTSKAEAHPDVRAVVTYQDLPSEGDESIASTDGRNNILASDRVLYKGHPIAAVAALGLHEAEYALSLIEVEYEVRPAVTDIESATASGAPVLHEQFDDNVDGHNQLELGDIERGLEAADVVVEREFHTKTVHQGYIEPHSATAWWGANDRVTLWTSSQGHFQIRDSTAEHIGLPPSSVKSVPMEIGGGFG